MKNYCKKINGHSKKELVEHHAGDFITNPKAIKEHFPIEVYYKSEHYWDSSFIEKFNLETCIWACDGVDDITPDMEIYLTTDSKRLDFFYKKYGEG